MKTVRWPSGLADAGALACAGVLFAAVALEVPARAESHRSGTQIATPPFAPSVRLPAPWHRAVPATQPHRSETPR